MGAVLGAITNGEAREFVINAARTAMERLPELIELVLWLIEVLMNVFNNPAEMPTEIHQNVIAFEQDIAALNRQEAARRLREIADMLENR
uniref:Uncharacterized protein n=1 Tax=Panagrolaimus sp. JU765 TaxID=591449 RepID=A0AC34RNX4_9BILA